MDIKQFGLMLAGIALVSAACADDLKPGRYSAIVPDNLTGTYKLTVVLEIVAVDGGQVKATWSRDGYQKVFHCLGKKDLAGTYSGTTLTLRDPPGASVLRGCETNLRYEFDGQNLSGKDFAGRPLVLKP